MDKVVVKIRRLSPFAVIPTKQHPGDAGFDLYVPYDMCLREGRQVLRLDFSMELPHGYAATIQPRSGFSVNGMLCEYSVLDRYQNPVVVDPEKSIDADVIRGLVDENYRGIVGVIIDVHFKIEEHECYVLKKGTRIAQMQIVEVPDVEFEDADTLSDTDRGTGGFGSTNNV